MEFQHPKHLHSYGVDWLYAIVDASSTYIELMAPLSSLSHVQQTCAFLSLCSSQPFIRHWKFFMEPSFHGNCDKQPKQFH